MTTEEAIEELKRPIPWREARKLAIAALRQQEAVQELKKSMELFMFEFSDLDEIIGGKQGKYIRKHFERIEAVLAKFDAANHPVIPDSSEEGTPGE